MEPLDVERAANQAITAIHRCRSPAGSLRGSCTDESGHLERERFRLGSKPLPGKIDAATYIMKHGPSVNHWNEYIFCAYAGHQTEAVFLTGIPDIKASLPHA